VTKRDRPQQPAPSACAQRLTDVGTRPLTGGVGRGDEERTNVPTFRMEALQDLLLRAIDRHEHETDGADTPVVDDPV
jgi:hypothetical protein